MSSGVAIYEAKNNGRDFIIKDFNRAAEKIEKVKKEDIIGKSVLKVFPREKNFGLFKVFQEVYKTGKPQHHPISLYQDQRITGWRENHVYKLPSGEIVAVYDDITERKQAEEQIKDSEKRLKILFDYAPDAYYISDLKGNFIDGNIAAERLMGYKKEELIRSSFLKLKLLSITDIAKANKLLAKNRRGQPTGPDGFILNRKDNSKVTVEISTYPVKINGRTLVLGLARDITERKQAEEEIKSAVVKWQTTFDAMKDAVSLIDKNGIILQCNQSYLNFFGKTETEVLGKHCWEIAHGTNKPINGCPFTKMKKNLHRESTEFSIDDKWFSVVVDPIIDANNDLISGVHIISDITERKQAEEDVKNAKDELQMILDSVPAIIFYKDIKSRIIRVNKTGANTLKMPVKDIIDKTTEELFPKEQAKKMRKSDQEVIISGKPKRDIIQPLTTPDGIRWAITDKIPHKDKKGKVIGVIGLAKDITVQKKAEQKLQQSYQRLKKTMTATIETVSKTIEAKDPYTAGHQHRVSQLTTAIAKELNLSPDKIEGIRIASLIHDIGKIGIPSEILSKPITLTDKEFNLIKDHSQIGYDILKPIDFSYPIAQIVLQHHERTDGSGYDQGLKGNKILLGARIIGVADVVEAMSSHRPYRPALGIDKALEEITQKKGIFYDPEVVDACLKLFKEKGFKFE